MGHGPTTSAAAERIAAADRYLGQRVATFEQRCQRFDCTLEAMYGLGLDDGSVVFDVGAGDGHFGARLHQGRECSVSIRTNHPPGFCESFWSGPCELVPSSRARYVPVVACIDGVDLDHWSPPRSADFFVALELLEHLKDPFRLLDVMMDSATKGVLISTPNPETTDVLGMDSTHVTPILKDALEAFGMVVETASFYGKPDDSLFAVYVP